MECFDTGHVASAGPAHPQGLLERPFEFSFILGVTAASPPRPENIIANAQPAPRPTRRGR